MATIKYNGMELEEFTSDKPIFFDPPKKCVVWFGPGDEPIETEVYECDPRIKAPFRTSSNTMWPHCAILPDTPKPRRATNRELARWLAQGNGEWYNVKSDSWPSSDYLYKYEKHDAPLTKDIRVRKWEDTEWHEPTVDYLGIDDDDYNFNKKYKGD